MCQWRPTTSCCAKYNHQEVEELLNLAAAAHLNFGKEHLLSPTQKARYLEQTQSHGRKANSIGKSSTKTVITLALLLCFLIQRSLLRSLARWLNTNQWRRYGAKTFKLHDHHQFSGRRSRSAHWSDTKTCTHKQEGEYHDASWIWRFGSVEEEEKREREREPAKNINQTPWLLQCRQRRRRHPACSARCEWIDTQVGRAPACSSVVLLMIIAKLRC